MKSWLAQGSSGKRVTLLPGTTFLHINALNTQNVDYSQLLEHRTFNFSMIQRLQFYLDLPPLKQDDNRNHVISEFFKTSLLIINIKKNLGSYCILTPKILVGPRLKNKRNKKIQTLCQTKQQQRHEKIPFNKTL